MVSTKLIAVALLAAAPVLPLQAQSPTPVTVRTNQSLIGAAVGNGRVQGQPVIDVQSNGRPAIGIGALSGKVDHFGSAGTVSVANNARLVGIDGQGGYSSPNSISVANPKQAPILSPAAMTAPELMGGGAVSAHVAEVEKRRRQTLVALLLVLVFDMVR